MDNILGAGLSNTLQKQFVEWRDAREPQELRMLDNYRDMMRISREDDTKTTGVSRAQKSLIFVGSTRGKIRSSRAKINDVLFGSGRMPFDTEPTNEELAVFADAIEKIITYLLDEGKFKHSIKTGVDSLATYGTGFIFGPFVKEETHHTTAPQADPMTGQTRLVEQSHTYQCPYFEHGRNMDVYPDPEAHEVKEGLGVYWAARKDKDFIRSLKGKPGYSDSAIDGALLAGNTMELSQGSDLLELARANLYRYEKDGRIWFQRYFGKIKRSELDEWTKQYGEKSAPAEEDEAVADTAEPANDSDEEMVEALVQLAGGYVIKAEENPYKKQRRPVSRCVYEDVEHEMWGVGIADNNDPHQRVINAAFRLYLEGKAYALLKMCSIDRSKYEVAEDFKFFPGKKFLMKSGLTPEERKSAMIWHDTDDVTDGWERVIEMSEGFSDDDTGITKYSQGTDSSHLNKTATGISMIMNASSLPIKEVISHIDELWIEDMIEALLDWALDYLEPETVKLLIGDQEAQAWEEIKRFGKTSFMTWKASGSQTFMAREVLMNKLQGFMQIALGNPITASLIDARELLEQVWDAGDIGKESPVMSDEDIQKKQQGQQQPGPMDLEKLKGDIAAESKHQAAEISILLEQMRDKSSKENTELNGAIQILLQQMKMAGTSDLQTEQLQADAAHKIVDIASGIDMADQQHQQSLEQQAAQPVPEPVSE